MTTPSLPPILVVVADPAAGEEVFPKGGKDPLYLHAYASLTGRYSGVNKWTPLLQAADTFISKTTAHNVAKRKGAKFYKVEPKP